jgi:hypothetical protein
MYTYFVTEELGKLERKVKFGKLHLSEHSNWRGTDMFFKPHPDAVDHDHQIFAISGVSFEMFQARFNDVSTSCNIMNTLNC